MAAQSIGEAELVDAAVVMTKEDSCVAESRPRQARAPATERLEHSDDGTVTNIASSRFSPALGLTTSSRSTTSAT